MNHTDSTRHLQEGGRFRYHLVPLKSRHALPLIGRLRSDLSGGDFFSHPFADFPVLESHIHPRFAIIQAGRMMLKLQTSELLPYQTMLKYADQAGHRTELEAVYTIYQAWVAPPASGPIANEENSEPGSDYDDFNPRTDEGPNNPDVDDDNETQPRRLSKRKRISPRDGGSPQPASKTGSKRLTSDLLRDHTEQMGGREPKKDSIMEWVHGREHAVSSSDSGTHEESAGHVSDSGRDATLLDVNPSGCSSSKAYAHTLRLQSAETKT